MPRDFNDIIPPSRRKKMGMPAEPAAGPAHVNNGHPSPDMIDMPRRSEPSVRTYPEPEEEHRPVHPAPRPMQPPSAAHQPHTLPPIESRFRFPIGTALLAVAVIAGCAAVLYSFSDAEVVVTPISAPATVTGEFVAYRDSGDLTFKQITAEKIATADVPSEGTKQVSDSAVGTITIRNEQTTSQPLIKNTRFETPEGLIYRIHDSIVVPASGELRVQVYADEAGEKYNIGPTTFKVPGLKGSKAYDLVTAKSEAAMQGGFVGTRASVNEATRESTYSSLQAKLTTELQNELASQVPEGYVLVPGASFPTYEPAPDSAKDTETLTLAQKGTITAVVFPEEALARAIAFKSLGTYDGSPVHFESVESLTITPTENGLSQEGSQFAFSIAGTATIIWKIDQEKIAGAVAGKSRDSSEIALKSFLEVDKARLILRPFWSSTFPQDPSEITVTVTGKEQNDAGV